MAREITVDELALMRSDSQWSKFYLAILKPNTVYTATLSAAPASNDQVYEISFGSGVGTLSDVKAGMTLYVGTSAGAYDLGMCRIRKAPIAGTFYIGLTSEIRWNAGGTIYLTVVDDFDLWPKHAVVSSGVMYMDVDVAYSNQHASFNPVPVMGPHAVAWLDGASVDVEFDASDSWVFGSSISGHAWTAPGASASSGMNTATPRMTYNTPGIYRVFDVVTAANTKTTTGVRYVFIYDRDANPPATVFQLAQCMGDNQSGGWMFDMAMEAEAGLSEIRDRSLVVLFAEDWYGDTQQSIGPIENRENIVCVGRVMGESIRWDSEGGYVHFTVQGLQWWLNKIKTFPVELSFVGAASDWTGMPALNLDRALWHILYWHSTAIETMDFYPTNDSRYMTDGKTIASTVWGQLHDLAFPKIFAVPGVDRFGRLSVEIDAQMTPAGSRTFPEVMEITAEDFSEAVEFSRQTVNDVSLISLNAQEVNSGGFGVTRYSLWPGHVPLRHGEPEMADRALCASQAQANSLAGLLGAWRTNPYPDIPVNFAMNNRMIDVFPRQYCSIEVMAPNTPRELAFTLRIIPRRVAIYFDGESGWSHCEVNFEGETEEGLSTDGDIPDIDPEDMELPNLPNLPDLPDLPILLPGEITSGSDGGPPKVLAHDALIGLVYTSNFDEDDPAWITVNAGLTQRQYQAINRIVICPNGAIYVGYLTTYNGTVDRECFLARAPYVGGTFEIIDDYTTIGAKIDGGSSSNAGIAAIDCNPLVAESVMYILGRYSTGGRIIYGNPASWTIADTINTNGLRGEISYGLGSWIFTATTAGADAPRFWEISPTGSVITNGAITNALTGTSIFHKRVSTTGTTYHYPSTDNNLTIGSDNCDSFEGGVGDGLLANLPTGYTLDPTGSLQMMAARKKSSDGGYTWTSIGSLPVVGNNWRFAWAGGTGISTSRWVAVYSYVMYSDDFGSTWTDKQGNLPDLNPLFQLNNVKVLEY